MGADARLFGPQRKAFPRLEVPGWLAPEADETLAAYGRRMAAEIDPRPPFFLGGVSLGGMIALEMARHLRPRGVFLIASCRSSNAIPQYLKVLEEWTHEWLDVLIDFAIPLSPLAVSILGNPTDADRRLCLRMFHDTPPEFLRWACSAVVKWPGSRPDRPVWQIHGADDHLIPARAVRPDLLVPGGGHLINLTHAGEVNGFIRERMK